ncbi:hypothetical protein ACFQI3_10430 [Hansschlegelia quercus]|uniref:Uncharacterized protein n=1 Tax=Hansschlegelia quercus TaxID=2528245 RepID=A0A4Q9GNW5_9HYPH|nr:hypothetical protein [Hansschlegelia quercus]TBN54474.1 hypothetical protein EYR15_06500 [Hansschlegelia quercus]
MAIENATNQEKLAAVEFRQRVRRLQIADLNDRIALRREEGHCTQHLEEKVEQLELDLAELARLVPIYASCVRF